MYQFEKLPQLVDKREGLKESGEYLDLGVKSKKVRVWHHSLTKKDLAGSTAEAFANYHVSLGWPGCGYAFVIEPKNVIKGPDGKVRARIVWAHNPGAKTYHVGNSNSFSLGICVAGDYRTDSLDEATLRSISELHQALVADGIGQEDKSHQQMPGYSWKECCVFDYHAAIDFIKRDGPAAPAPLPGQYQIQEGDTFWSIAGKDGAQGLQVEDLIVANPGVDPGKLKVGQIINLGEAKNAYTRPADEPKKPQAAFKFPLPDPTLKRGSKGGGVVLLQKALCALFFYPDKGAKNHGVDGEFGPNTEAALKRFQSVYMSYGMSGIYGPDTRNKLKAALKSKGY